MLKWFDSRTGFVTVMKAFLTEDVPGGASYWYAFGSATVFALIVQIVTGIFLTAYYSPSTQAAWESTLFIYQKVTLGAFVISLHSWGSTAMIALVMMHLIQVVLWGAYKKPREFQWIVGMVLLIVTFVLGLTGYLLPWDLNAYFASQVALNIVGGVPIVGPAIQSWLQGGPTMSTLTINKFFGIHVWLAPAFILTLVVAHLMIFRWNGAAGPAVDKREGLKHGRFWPDQLFMDAVASFAVMAIIVVLAIVSPAPLDAKADPNNSVFVSGPAWYFTALYYLLEIFHGQQGQLLATVVVPALAVLTLILLPWIDRNPSRELKRRPVALGFTAAAVVLAVGLSVAGQWSVNQKAAERGQAPPNIPGGPDAAKLAALAEAPRSDNAVASAHGQSDLAKGEALYKTNCQSCHLANGQGVVGSFPPLAKNPHVTGDRKTVVHAVKYGMAGKLDVPGSGSYKGEMPAWKGTLTDKEVAALVTYIRNAWQNNASPVTVRDVTDVTK